MKVKVLKLGEVVFDGKASKITLPAVDGEITILPKHISIVTVLTKGRLIIFSQNKEPFQKEINGGFCSFSNEVASILIN